MLMTKALAEKKKEAGFTHVVICIVPVNGWLIGDVLSWHKSEVSANRKAKSVQRVVKL